MSSFESELNSSPDTPSSGEVSEIQSYSTTTTADGSLTFYSREFGQHFHNLHGAREEALEK
ncbi:MAG: hypothetical protein AAFX40_18875, partial [Cyanobacteria bacterium J06639_1]